MIKDGKFEKDVIIDGTLYVAGDLVNSPELKQRISEITSKNKTEELLVETPTPVEVITEEVPEEAETAEEVQETEEETEKVQTKRSKRKSAK